MTLRDIFANISANPSLLLWFLLCVPLLTFLSSIWQNPNTPPQQSPNRHVYAILAYLACIPGIFAITLNMYLFLFERQSIWDMNLVTQLLPIVTMVGTLIIIKRNIPFEYVPAFGKLSGFVTLVFAMIGIMWFVDRLRIYAITYVPFQYIAIGFIGMLLLIRFGWNKMF
ncbi:hypothetical protein LV89_00358 [Arcicella aurantiaca]|uniref:Uncharacterized protein n=1 Tax=Arcicella aurantiaca TaxID=591202 RepID=A0A316EH42_9BACT|nr:hypothetical protein [Arcicella aurantiaca]PWK28805.1 hypothetical protein LV89_00358 [Arcicella aurantiaca]